jgi:uncharacterized protein YkwD
MRLPALVIAAAAIASCGPVTVSRAATCPDADLNPTAESIARAAVATVCLVNQERQAAGVPPLELDMGLTAVGFGYARHMVAEKYFGHVSPEGVGLTERLAQIQDPAELSGEDLYWGSGVLATPAETVRGWMGSAEHRANMLDADFRRIGVAVALGSPIVGVEDAATYVADFDSGLPVEPGPAPVVPSEARSAANLVGVTGAVLHGRRFGTLAKRLVHAWIEAVRGGDAATFCGLEDNRMLVAQTGKINGAGLEACVRGFRANPGLPAPSQISLGRVHRLRSKATVTMKMLGRRAVVALANRGGHWKIDSVRA